MFKKLPNVKKMYVYFRKEELLTDTFLLWLKLEVFPVMLMGPGRWGSHPPLFSTQEIFQTHFSDMAGPVFSPLVSREIGHIQGHSGTFRFG